MDEQTSESKEEEVMGEGSEMEELIPGRRRYRGSWKQGLHITIGAISYIKRG